LLTIADFYGDIDSTSGNTAASHFDDLRAFANGKFELTGISLLREGATDVAASVSYGNDTLTLSLEKFEASIKIENLSEIEIGSLDLLNNDINLWASDNITSTTTFISHDDYGLLIKSTVEDLDYFDLVDTDSPLVYGMFDDTYYAADASFTLTNVYDFGDKVLEMSEFETYVNSVQDLSDIYVEIL
jgi:hypothetical protein